jgi:hypothetical protein
LSTFSASSVVLKMASAESAVVGSVSRSQDDNSVVPARVIRSSVVVI